MRKVQYGRKTIEYSSLIREGLKSHYITVARDSGVILKGNPVSPGVADKLILKKAPWILNKLEAVGMSSDEEIVTGSRLPYLGRNYYVELIQDPKVDRVKIRFTYSKFIISVKRRHTIQDEINAALNDFYQSKAIEKITPRILKLSKRTNLKYNGLAFRKMNKRWGSCTPDNKIIINFDAVKLPYSLIDYLVIHELCHTKMKDHSKAFWAELSKHVPNWRGLDERVQQIKLV